MEYNEALDWLFAQLPMFSRVGAAAYKPGLERSEALSRHFGDPHRRWKAIHVAGTNGKGSVSSLIAATLQSQGYKTALYTSPHLVDFRERMRVNGEMIPRDRVVDFVERWKTCGYTGDRPSFFELTMMMAFEWFAGMNVDYAVIEVGMGGRLDSTNIITPLLSVITNISKDHTQFLGETLAQIASEKAGIIKPGIPVVIGEADTETENVFRSKAAEVGAPLREAYREIDNDVNVSLECGLHGDYQQKNVNTARVAIDELRRLGIEIDEESIHRGFHDVESLTGLKGRWTVLSDNPLVICDTGHNEAGLTYNLEQLAKLRAGRCGAKLRFVIGFVADKDVPHILPMFPHDAVYYVSQAQIPRAMNWQELLEHCRSLGLDAEGYPDVSTAFEAAKKEAVPQDIIYIGGSTFIVADFFATDMKEI
ncbi:MAG: bifunctional folylpolyglutamate synthase/dihydrofolate synthase [Muribaculaceae bacterium]|nr:bifunctional folylpolyglutamate synthase/dihydrofolate synthase [Muribaculaceae bacterium]